MHCHAGGGAAEGGLQDVGLEGVERLLLRLQRAPGADPGDHAVPERGRNTLRRWPHGETGLQRGAGGVRAALQVRGLQQLITQTQIPFLE